MGEGEQAASGEPTERAGQCPVLMHEGKRCGRPIHAAPKNDKMPVCLMHSRDPGKSDEEFQIEFERILEKAGEGIADFSYFIFPSATYAIREFAACCVFHSVTFERRPNFLRTEFKQDADFAFTTFKQNAFFALAKFNRDANFKGATFERDAIFDRATFAQAADFPGAQFRRAVKFRETEFRRDRRTAIGTVEDFPIGPEPVLLPAPVFSSAEFAKPKLVAFYKTYLGRALFHNSDVTKISFSSVEWPRRYAAQKRMVFDESVDPKLAPDLTAKKESKDERDYELIAELYHQLKKNYDDRKDYSTAGDFHYGEMEMNRLHSKRGNPVARWLHRNLGLVAWYKWASHYGESYARPLLWLVAVLALFTFLFPMAGLEWNEGKAQGGTAAVMTQNAQAGAASELSYRKFAEYMKAYPGRKWLVGSAFFGHSLMTALSVAGFQKELRYEPSYPWGRALALGELLLTSTLIALFLLAVRRQFRR